MMLKGFSATALVVALLASTAVAFPPMSNNFQVFDVDLCNAILQVGDGAASSTNLGLLMDTQSSTDDIRHTTAFQGFNGAITQTAGAVGMGNVAGVGQEAGLSGIQGQNPRTGQQFQHLNSDLDQNAFKLGGTGSVLGVESAVGIGTQLIFTPYGATANVQAIGDVIYDAIGGGPCGSVMVNGGATIGAGQIATPW